MLCYIIAGLVIALITIIENRHGDNDLLKAGPWFFIICLLIIIWPLLAVFYVLYKLTDGVAK